MTLFLSSFVNAAKFPKFWLMLIKQETLEVVSVVSFLLSLLYQAWVRTDGEHIPWGYNA